MASRFVKGLLAATLFAAALLSTTTTASAVERWVKIINNTGYTMRYFYASHRDAPTWEEDILGNDVLPSGYSVDINMNDGSGYCIFDFKAVFSNGAELIDENKNICELDTFTYN